MRPVERNGDSQVLYQAAASWRREDGDHKMASLGERITSRKGKDVYEWIRLIGIISKQELHELSGYTISTLTRVLEELIGEGLIEETGFGESTGGRRPTLYQIRADYGYIFGLDISRGTSRLVLCDMRMNKLDSVVWKMTSEVVPERLLDEVEEAARQMMVRHRLPAKKVLGIGVGAVGPLDRVRGVIHAPERFPAPGWYEVPIREMLEQRLSLPVWLDNGANTALLGEYWSDTEERPQHVLYVHVGVGIRSAVMVGGKIVYGAVDMEGAAGQMVIQSDGRTPISASGNYGAWESYITSHALERVAVSYLKQGRQTLLRDRCRKPEFVTYEDLERAYHDGDPLAREIFTQAASYFGIGLANLLNILHPEQVILGGPIVGSIDVFYEDAIRIARHNTYYYPQYQVKFRRSRLQDDAVAIGATALVIGQLSA